LIYNPAPVEATMDSQGNWVVPEQPSAEEVNLPCRYEPNIRQNYVVNEANGDRLVYSFVVFLSKNSIEIKGMQDVELINEFNEVFYKGKAVRFHKGQLHNRIWI